jgi:hypothetical protein
VHSADLDVIIRAYKRSLPIVSQGYRGAPANSPTWRNSFGNTRTSFPPKVSTNSPRPPFHQVFPYQKANRNPLAPCCLDKPGGVRLAITASRRRCLFPILNKVMPPILHPAILRILDDCKGMHHRTVEYPLRYHREPNLWTRRGIHHKSAQVAAPRLRKLNWDEALRLL